MSDWRTAVGEAMLAPMRDPEHREEISWHEQSHGHGEDTEKALQEARQDLNRCIKSLNPDDQDEGQVIKVLKGVDEFWQNVKQKQQGHDSKHQGGRQEHSEGRNRKHQEYREVSERSQRIPGQHQTHSKPRKKQGGFGIHSSPGKKRPGRLSTEYEGLKERRVMLGRMLGKGVEENNDS